VLFLDLDRFKVVNDSLGHSAGDRLLVAVADRLSATMGPTDIVARFGGDEFTVLLDGIGDVGGAVAIAQRITETLRAPLDFEGRDLVLSASIGIAMSAGVDSASDMLRHADLAMYAAKDKGRSRWELFDVQSAPHLVERHIELGHRLSARQTLDSRDSVKTAIEAHDPVDSVPFHDRDVNGITRGQAPSRLEQAARSLDLSPLDGQHLVDDVKHRGEGRRDRLPSADRDVAMEDLLEHLCIGHQSVAGHDRSLHQLPRNRLVRMVRAYEVHGYVRVDEDHGAPWPGRSPR